MTGIKVMMTLPGEFLGFFLRTFRACMCENTARAVNVTNKTVVRIEGMVNLY